MTTFDINLQIVRSPDLVAAEMDGDLVMMSIDKGEYFGIGGIGPRIWELLEQPVTINQITAIVCEEFDVDESTCRQDTLNFARELLEMGLVRAA